MRLICYAILGLSSIEPAEYGDQLKCREKVPGGLVIARRDGAELLDPAEEVFDQMACLVQRLVICSLGLAIAFRRDNSGFSSRLQRLDHPLISIVRLVRQQHGCFHLWQ